MSDAITYLSELLGDRDTVEWFTDAPCGAATVGGPADIYLRTASGEVTWGWGVEPVPLEPGERRFRRLRHPDGWRMLIDADDPELIALPATAELHSVRAGERMVAFVEVDVGEVPDPTEADTLHRAGLGHAESHYRLDPAWPTDAVSEALELWTRSHLGRDVTFEPVEASAEDLAAISRLLAGGPEPDPADAVSPLGHDDEIADIVSRFEVIAWFQGDLSWPDADDQEAFRDQVDVRMRDPEGRLVWLAAVQPPAASDDLEWLRLPEEGRVGLDPGDPTRLVLDPDRLVLAVSRVEDGFEPAGVAVPRGTAPTPAQWEELRRVQAEHPGSLLVHAPGWSETLVSAALEVWAWAWSTGMEVAFAYDFDDPLPQAALEANNQLGEQQPEPPSPSGRRPSLCMYQPPAQMEAEDPLPCGRKATHYYELDGRVVTVCGDHLPGDRKTTVLMRS